MGLFKKNHSAEPATTPGSGNWQVGDYYNANGKEGVVIWVDETGRYIKIVHLEQAELPWCTSAVSEVVTDAVDKYDGSKNLEVISKIQDWRYKFPAFAWCALRGEGWYLPASEELVGFRGKDCKEITDKVNSTLKKKGGKKIGGFISDYYWSSTESEEWYTYEWSDEAKEKYIKRISLVSRELGEKIKNDPESFKPTKEKKALEVMHGYKVSAYCKSSGKNVRAVAMIDTESSVCVEPAPAPAPVCAPVDVECPTIWKVGDYYNVNGKEGVVFWVDQTGKHGKIVSMDQIELKWCLYEGYDDKVRRKSADEDNGMNNQQEVMKINDWQIYYHAHAWCAEYGSGWYLPAVNELKELMQGDNMNKVNETLAQMNRELIANGKAYWSSTCDRKEKKSAWYVVSKHAGEYHMEQFSGHLICSFNVRAVAAF